MNEDMDMNTHEDGLDQWRSQEDIVEEKDEMRAPQIVLGGYSWHSKCKLR